MSRLETEPRCKWCNGILKLPSKETCSYQCRVNLNHQTDFYQQRNDKSRKTCLEKWGVDNPNKVPEVRQKITETCINRYGAKVSPATANSAKSRVAEMNRKGRESLKNRYGLRKNQDDDPTLTEYENRLSQGYTRIWDCGHARYEWKK